MDREGFCTMMLSNSCKTSFVAGGISCTGDRFWTQREAEKKAKERREKHVRSACGRGLHREKSTLTRSDKTRLVTEYTGLASKLSEVEDYDRDARQKLLTMSDSA